MGKVGRAEPDESGGNPDKGGGPLSPADWGVLASRPTVAEMASVRGAGSSALGGLINHLVD